MSRQISSWSAINLQMAEHEISDGSSRTTGLSLQLVPLLLIGTFEPGHPGRNSEVEMVSRVTGKDVSLTNRSVILAI